MTIREAKTEDVPNIASMLVEAFENDPLLMFLTGSAKDKRRAREAYFKYCLEQARMKMVLGSAAALWLKPEDSVSFFKQLFRIPEMIRQLGLRGVPNLLKTFRTLEINHPKVKHYYLMAIGVPKADQGTGIGSALLAYTLKECDRGQLPAYLETSNPQALPLYQRHGFVVKRELSVCAGAPRLWTLWREPCKQSF